MDRNQLEKAKQEVRLTQLEIDTKIIKSDIKVIRDNHLTHMAKDIDKIDTKVDKLDMRLWAVLILLVGSLLIPLIRSLW
jgi:predicted  nucleic acid-binding Zn-ribbon protein